MAPTKLLSIAESIELTVARLNQLEAPYRTAETVQCRSSDNKRLEEMTVWPLVPYNPQTVPRGVRVCELLVDTQKKLWGRANIKLVNGSVEFGHVVPVKRELLEGTNLGELVIYKLAEIRAELDS